MFMFSRKKFYLILFIIVHSLKADDFDCDKDEPLNCPDYCQQKDISTSFIIKYSTISYVFICVIITILVGLLSLKTKQLEKKDLLKQRRFIAYENWWNMKISKENKEKKVKEDEAPPISEDSMSFGTKNKQLTYNKAFDEKTRKQYKDKNMDLNDPVWRKKYLTVLEDLEDQKQLKKEKSDLKKFKKRGNIFIPNETDLMAANSKVPKNVVLKDVFFNETENEIFSIGTEIDDVQLDSEGVSQSTIDSATTTASKGKTKKNLAKSKKK